MSQRTRKKPLKVKVAANNLRAVVNRIWQMRYQQGTGYPAVDLAEAMEALIEAVRAEERAADDGRK